MLAMVTGTVLDVTTQMAVVDVCGLGFEMQLSRKASSLCSVGKEVSLHCHVQFSDAGPTLFGFADGLEKAVFLRLLSVRGIGGKLALQVLQGMTAEAVVQAVSFGDPSGLTGVPGIGKKTAERICFELQEKMSEGLPKGSTDSLREMAVSDSETVMEALESLGFPRQSSSEALAAIAKKRGSVDGLGVEDLIMLALRELNSGA